MCYRGPTHRGPKSGCKLVTLFGSYCDDGVSAGIWVINRGPKSGCKLVTLFGGYSCDGVSAGICVLKRTLVLFKFMLWSCSPYCLYKFVYT